MNRSKQGGMGIKAVILLLVGLVFASVAEAQQQASIRKVGWLSSGSSSVSRHELLGRELHALGYVEGKNITIEVRYADEKFDRLPSLVDELIRLKVEVIVTNTIPAALALKNATKTIPIVFIGSGDPVAAGLVDSLARPGGNITGFTQIGLVLAAKRLELLKETIPKLSRVAVLWNPKDSNAEQQWRESQLAARELALQLYSMEVSLADEFESAFKEATKVGSTALAVTQVALNSSNQRRIVALAAKNRLPAIYPQADFVASGGLMSYGANREETFRRAAVYVDKILKGSKPTDLPIEQPMKFDLVINLKTAKTLNLAIPPLVLMRGTKVIK